MHVCTSITNTGSSFITPSNRHENTFPSQFTLLLCQRWNTILYCLSHPCRQGEVTFYGRKQSLIEFLKFKYIAKSGTKIDLIETALIVSEAIIYSMFYNFLVLFHLSFKTQYFSKNFTGELLERVNFPHSILSRCLIILNFL